MSRGITTPISASTRRRQRRCCQKSSSSRDHLAGVVSTLSNTLWRTIIYQNLGLWGYADEQRANKHAQRPEAMRVREVTGGKLRMNTWEEFYSVASASERLFPVKIHRRPVDRQPVIRVVRDGRKASCSYFRFLKSCFPEAKKSLLAVLAGDDTNGHWSSHYADWAAHRGRSLELRCEDLVDPES